MEFLLSKAIEIAQIAASKQFHKLVAAGPRFSVHQADLAGNITGPSLGTMLDNCGGAWINLSGRSPLVNYIKKHYHDESGLGGCNTRFEGKGWCLRKGIYKGYHLSLEYSLRCRQEMSIHEAANEAAAAFLRENGIECRMHSYID